MAEFNNIKQLDGQPWSSWKKICEQFSTGERMNKMNDYSHFMKLNRSDMPIYGLCPKTEVFELVVCNYCGLKYKLPAFAEHINLRHSGDKQNRIYNIEKPLVTKKGKLKRPREKFKSVTIKVDSNLTLEYLDIVSDRQSMTIDSETVAKIKQLHVNTKTNVISSENEVPNKKENGLSSNNGGRNVDEVDLNNELISKKLNDSVIVKTHDASSPLAQEGEKINMQPIVKLSPIPSNPHLTNNAVRDISEPQKLEMDPVTAKSSSYNPDLHCGVLNESVPCLERLDCKLHSVSLKKLVIGRSKLYEVLLTNYIVDRNITKETSRVKPAERPNSEVVTIVSNSSSNSDNNTTLLITHERNYDQVPKAILIQDSAEEKRKKCDFISEDNVIPYRTIRSTNDLQGLSLPVSIKNPSILCQLQNIKSKYYIPVKPARCSSIHDLLNVNFGHKRVKEQMISQAYKENTESILIALDGSNKTPATKPSELKLEWFQQWHPGYRRVGGLLYANHNITCVRKRTFISTVSSFSHEEHYNSFPPQRLNVIRDKSEIIDLCDPDTAKTELKRMKFELSTGHKKSINSVISKQKNNFIISSSVPKSTFSQKIHFSQTTNKAFVCKRTNSNINKTLPAKVKRQDGMINIISPVYGKINKTCL